MRIENRELRIRESSLLLVAQLSTGLILLLGLALLFHGCAESLRQLQAFKKEVTAGNYQAIAAQEVTCEPKDAGCNQVHLIKGDACFRLANSDVDPMPHYTCAARHLQLGIEQTQEWEQDTLNLGRTQTYENLAETLRNLQDLQRGAESNATGARFLAVAEDFLRLEPEHIGAIYYATKARFRALQPALLQGTDTAQLCGRLKQLRAPIEQLIANHAGTPAELWSRYEQNYDLLRGELTTAQRLLPNCP